MLSCDFITFSAFLALVLGLFCTKLATQHYLVYIILFKLLELKIIIICWKLLVKLRFYGFLRIFVTFTYKVAQIWLILYNTWHTTLYGMYYSVKVVRIENHSHMLEITCLVTILWVLSILYTFAHKVAQTLFVIHETLHTILFGIYYCV